MSDLYLQIPYPTANFAKSMTDDSAPGGILDGWRLVCIHPIVIFGEVTEYIATFTREGEPLKHDHSGDYEDADLR